MLKKLVFKNDSVKKNNTISSFMEGFDLVSLREDKTSY